MNEKSAITILAEALADMTAKAVEAEQRAAKAQRQADEWYGYYQTKAKEVDELKAQLDVTRLERNKHEAVANGLRSKLEKSGKEGSANE